MKYNIFFPKNYSKGQPGGWPLIVFLHGASERGNDINKLLNHGPHKFVEKKNLPFVILSPQCAHGEYWETDKVMYLLDLAIEKHSIDPKKIYLTGLSMGGFGTWQVASHYPERFAAIAPICGGGSRYMAFKLRNMPVWVFHGAKDTIIPVSKSEEMVYLLQKEGNNPEFTIYPDAAHDSWTATYKSPKLYEWFLEHEIRGKGKRNKIRGIKDIA